MLEVSLSDAIDYRPPVVKAQATLREAIAQIVQSNFDYALVIDCSDDLERNCDRIWGIITAKDALSLLMHQPQAHDLQSTRVSDLFPPSAIQVSIAELSTPHNLLALFQRHRVQYLPIVDAENLAIGAISEQKLMRSLLATADLPSQVDLNFDFISDQQLAIRQEAETALQESEARLQDIIDNAPAVIYLKDLQGRYILINHKFQILFYLAKEEVLGKTDRDIFPKELADRLWEHDQQVIAEEMPKEFEENIEYAESSRTFLSIKFPLHNATNQLYAVCGISTDISDRKRSEQLVATSLAEKEVLLKEIHHRVKNNMHVISNLLDLQTQYIEDENTIGLFADSQNRINTMALIHEQLYQSPTLGAIRFDSYLKDLVDNLLASYSFHPASVQLQLALEPVTVNIETAMPCGLIVNELVSNCLKYAFPHEYDGIVKLQLHIHPNSKERLRERQFVLIVGDNGIGIHENINWKNTNSLGLRLVHMLTRQLEGEIELDRTEGTVFRLTFTELQYKERL